MVSFFSFCKKLFFILGIVLLSYQASLAAPQFSATTSGPTIKGTLSGTSLGDGPFLMFYQTTPFLPIDTGANPTIYNSVQGLSVAGNTIGFNIDGVGNTLYYVRVVGKVGRANYISPPAQVTTGDQARIAPLSYDAPASDCKSIYINSAVLDASWSDYDISLKYRSAEEVSAGFEYRIAVPHKGKGVEYLKGIAEDGTYTFRLDNLTGKKYYITHIVKSISTGKTVFAQEGNFDSCKGNIAVGTTAALDDINKRSYRFLAPIEIPSLGIHLTLLPDQDLCKEQEAEGTVPPGSCDNQIGDFINLILRILISVAAIFLVIQIIIKGYQYMVSDIPRFKINAKERVFEAFGGLLLALSAFLILNTINPKLVAGTLNVDGLEIGVENFQISGPGSYDGKPISINFNKEAYPAALLASQKTGVDVAFILAIFGQETGSGKNVGRCFWVDPKANMYDEDKVALKTITTELSKDINTTPVSCAAISGGTFNGHGGAIGYTQFRPVTWLSERIEAKGYLGRNPNPWSLDAIMVEAVYLKKLGALTNEKEAACKYFSGPGGYCTKNQSINTYGTSVMGKKLSLQKQIAESKAKGEIK